MLPSIWKTKSFVDLDCHLLVEDIMDLTFAQRRAGNTHHHFSFPVQTKRFRMDHPQVTALTCSDYIFVIQMPHQKDMLLFWKCHILAISIRFPLKGDSNFCFILRVCSLFSWEIWRRNEVRKIQRKHYRTAKTCVLPNNYFEMQKIKIFLQVSSVAIHLYLKIHSEMLFESKGVVHL